MHPDFEVLGVYLQANDEFVRVGELVRNADRITTFHVDESYINLPERPILSSLFECPGDHDTTVALLRDSTNLRGGRGIPAWFENLLPEGALRQYIEAISGPMHDFDLLRHVGGDLPGAVIVTSEGMGDHAREEMPTDLRFSLAGVQSKLSMLKTVDGYEMLENGIGGDTVIKLPSKKHRALPEVEFSSMRLAASVGIDTAYVELVPLERLHGIPEELIEACGPALGVERFDRTLSGQRIHMEDFNQILGVLSDRKYAAANDETVLKMSGRFGAGRGCFLQACRRAAVNILVGNTDAHLKNWSIWYPEPTKGRLSPAYDIVAGAVYDHSDEMALRFRRTRNASIIDGARFARAAVYAGYSPTDVREEIDLVIEKAADTWGALLQDLPMPTDYAEYLLRRAQNLALTQEVGSDFLVPYQAAHHMADGCRLSC